MTSMNMSMMNWWIDELCNYDYGNGSNGFLFSIWFRADPLFKETIEMIVSCYKQHFKVSVFVMVLMRLILVFMMMNILVTFQFWWSTKIFEMEKTWYISALPEWYNVKATSSLSVDVPLLGSHKYIRVKIFQIFCLKVDSIFLAKNAHPVHWGHISMLNADLACMEQLLGRWYINQLKKISGN